jgi:hypothetical protein
MRTISNDYREVELLDLCPVRTNRGPFLVLQQGYAPGDADLRESLFVLRRDGSWVDVNVYLSAGDPELMSEALFSSAQQVMELFADLPAEPRVAELPVSEAGLRAWLEQHPRGTLLSAARTWVASYRERHRQRAAGT